MSMKMTFEQARIAHLEAVNDALERTVNELEYIIKTLEIEIEQTEDSLRWERGLIM
jgi:uncharacterized coiled-coil protein SlyX